MKIAYINTFHYGSTGTIIQHCAELARRNGDEVRLYISTESKGARYIENCYYWGWSFERLIHYYLSVLTGLNGCFSIISSIIMIRRLKQFNPDIIHLHNLHNCYLNLPMLFSYIKKENKRVIWTLHDCWAFTGKCPHYTMVDCHKWKDGCYECPQRMSYPKSLPDQTKIMYRLKKKWFTGVQNLEIVTPSHWLAEEVKKSFLAEYPTTVIHNGIDLSIFKPTPSDFRSQHNLEDKYIILGVAYGWDHRKGLDVFISLAKMLPIKYQIVLVGTEDILETILPPQITPVRRTSNKQELAQIYTTADVFINPTREDNFPTVNIESLACGAPVITFNTGGSPETIDDTCGVVISKDNLKMLCSEIIHVCEEKPYTIEACIEKAQGFNKNKRLREYIQLYSRVQSEQRSQK